MNKGEEEDEETGKMNSRMVKENGINEKVVYETVPVNRVDKNICAVESKKHEKHKGRTEE